MHLPALFSRKTSPQQYRSGKNLAEYNRTVTKLLQKKHFLAPFGRFYGVFRPNGHQIKANMHFLAPFGHLYGVFRPNGQQIEAKCIYPHCSVEKLACNNTVRARTWLNTTERSANCGKECIFLHHSAAFMAFPARTLSKLRQKMHFLAPFGRFYGVFCPNG